MALKKIKTLLPLLIVVILGTFFFALTEIKEQKLEIDSFSTEKEKNQQLVIEQKEQIKTEPSKINEERNNLPDDIFNDQLEIIEKLVSWGYETSKSVRLIDTIIIHSSYDALSGNPYSAEGVIYEYKIYGVSPHYLIDRNGNILQLVKEKNIAYHAGSGKMPDGRTNINSFSIGIEIINTTTVGPNESQYDSLIKLVKFLESKYEIKNIFGHNEITPERKTDPWNFDWQKFNEMLED